MKIRIVWLLLCLVVTAPALYAQTTEESVDSNEAAATAETAAAPETSTTASTHAAEMPPSTPRWISMVRVAAVAGPFAFLVLAWLIGGYLHHRLVRREQEQFPLLRGTRAPQWVPMMASGLLFFVPAILFIVFEVLSRDELRQGIGGVVDEWQPVTQRAWLMLAVCLVLAIAPWLFARRADTVS